MYECISAVTKAMTTNIFKSRNGSNLNNGLAFAVL